MDVCTVVNAQLSLQLLQACKDCITAGGPENTLKFQEQVFKPFPTPPPLKINDILVAKYSLVYSRKQTYAFRSPCALCTWDHWLSSSKECPSPDPGPAPGQLWLVAWASTCPVPVWAHIGGGSIQLGAVWGGQCPAASMEAVMGKGSG